MLIKILLITVISIISLLVIVSAVPLIYICVMYAIYNIARTVLIFIKKYKFTEISELMFVVSIIIYDSWL